MKLVLFDIDGTLLWTHGAGRRAITKALLAEMGTTGPIDDFRFDGKTDPQIVRALMRAAGHPDADSEAHIDSVCRRYVTLLSQDLTDPKLSPNILPGVEDLLDALQGRSDVVLGLLTGNVVEGARLKLTAAGVDFALFRVGAFGSDAEERGHLPPIAAERAALFMDGVPSGDQVVIIGDTPADVTCGAGISARPIGVATGSYSVAELRSAGAFAAFEDLSETQRVMTSIFA